MGLGRGRAQGQLSPLDRLEKCPCEPKEGWKLAECMTGKFTRGLVATGMLPDGRGSLVSYAGHPARVPVRL